MKTRILTTPASHDHKPPAGHPETPERYAAVLRAVEASGLPHRAAERTAQRPDLERVHVPALVDAVLSAAGRAKAGEVALDADTWMSAGSLDAALAAAGAGLEAVDAVLDGTDEALFVATRPPGHHAEPDRAMGFCLFNTVAIAAMAALERPDIERVAVFDFDVHHGNGTQAWAETEPRALFASIHQNWLYPGTGAASETGVHDNLINVPIKAGTQGACWRSAIESRIADRIAAFQPDLLLVSAGFDAHTDDPLAGLALSDADYDWVGGFCAQLAQAHASSRLVCVMEGGYDCAALERSVGAFLRALQAA